MKTQIAAAALFMLCIAPAEAQVRIDLDMSLADRALALVCSGQAVDEAAVRASPLVQAQITHNVRLTAEATMDNYVAALRGLSACAAPTPDPFRVAAILEAPDVFRAKVAAIRARGADMSQRAAAMLAPFMLPGESFSGQAVLAVPYFSCGGFAERTLFFVDIACLDENLDQDIDALTLMIAHETYHAIQAETYFPIDEDTDHINTADDGVAYVFSALLLEGMAEHVASSSTLPESGGPLTELNSHFARDNAQRPRSNFLLLTTLIDYVARHPEDPRVATETAYNLGFSGGTYQQFAYYVGARMAADLETAWGRDALICVSRLPSEQFVLAHDSFAQQTGETRRRLGPAAVEVAQRLAERRAGPTFETCRRT